MIREFHALAWLYDLPLFCKMPFSVPFAEDRVTSASSEKSTDYIYVITMAVNVLFESEIAVQVLFSITVTNHIKEYMPETKHNNEMCTDVIITCTLCLLPLHLVKKKCKRGLAR